MTRSPLAIQAELPRSIPLFRYAPVRTLFSWRDWNPALVRSVADIPQYLILGQLDPSTFAKSAGGWSARWQGTEVETRFEVAFKADTGRWEIRQTWCGTDGGFSNFPTKISLDKVIGEAMYTPFPHAWDKAAQSQLEAAYRVTVIEQPESAYALCGIPDGAFRTIIFPIAVRNLRPMRQWLIDIVKESQPAYPIIADAKLVFQALNYLEGKAPAWTAQELVAFKQSMAETGLVPQGFPVREVANDGSAAWTLRREIYFLFITLPFAGLTDFLNRIASTNGPIRTVSDPDLRFELRPIVIPGAFEMQTESLALWDKERTTRSFLQFGSPGEKKTVPTVQQVSDVGHPAADALAKVESISGDVVTAIEQVLQRATK